MLDVLVDGNVPPLPPHITLKQAKQFTRSLMGGEPELGAVVKNTLREVVTSVLPR